MKRFVAVLLALALLGLFACGKESLQPTEPNTLPTTETQASKGEMPPEAASTELRFTTTYAKTPTYFYGKVYRAIPDGEEWGGESVLARAPLRNIADMETIILPKTYKGYDELQSVDICGVDEWWLYASLCYEKCDDNDQYVGLRVLYRISHDTLKAELIDEYPARYYCETWYNAASNSFIFLREMDGYMQLEAMRTDTEERSVIFDDREYFTNIWTYHWRNTDDGMIALEEVHDDGHPQTSKHVVIDKDNRVVPVKYEDIKYAPRLYRSDEIKAVCGGYVYYVTAVNGQNNLYRKNSDGTGETLLRAGTNIRQLLSVGDKLCCIAYDPTRQDESGEVSYIGLYALDENGKVEKVLVNGSEYDNGYWLRSFDGMIIMMNYGIYGNGDGYFEALYDPATGALFA